LLGWVTDRGDITATREWTKYARPAGITPAVTDSDSPGGAANSAAVTDLDSPGGAALETTARPGPRCRGSTTSRAGQCGHGGGPGGSGGGAAAAKGQPGAGRRRLGSDGDSEAALA